MNYAEEAQAYYEAALKCKEEDEARWLHFGDVAANMAQAEQLERIAQALDSIGNILNTMTNVIKENK